MTHSTPRTRWPVAETDADFQAYVEGRPAESVALFRRFVTMARGCGPVTFELQGSGGIILRGTRRIFASVVVGERGITGHLNLPRALSDPRIRRAAPLTKRLYMNGYAITSAAQLDDTFRGWLAESRDVGDGIHSSA